MIINSPLLKQIAERAFNQELEAKQNILNQRLVYLRNISSRLDSVTREKLLLVDNVKNAQKEVQETKREVQDLKLVIYNFCKEND